MRALKNWLPVVIWIALILIGSTDLLSAQTSRSWLRTIFGFEVPFWLHVAVRKLAHLTVYAILAALTWRADRRWLVMMAIALAVATTDETIQSFSAKRTGSPWDVGIDMIGAGALTILLQRTRHLRDQLPRTDAH